MPYKIVWKRNGKWRIPLAYWGKKFGSKKAAEKEIKGQVLEKRFRIRKR